MSQPEGPPNPPRRTASGLWTAVSVLPPRLPQQKLPLEEFLKLLLGQLQVGIMACDETGNIVICNDTMTTIDRIPAEREALSEWAQEFRLFEGDGKSPMDYSRAPLPRALRGESFRDFRYAVEAAPGDLKYRSANGRPLFDGAGRKVGAVIALHDITDQHHMEDELLFRATRDPLTGLPLRAHFLELLHRALETGTSGVAVVLLDVDQFKLVNSGLGATAGDRLIKEIARRLAECAEPDECVGHLGGDEFICFKSGVASASEAETFAIRVRGVVARPLSLDGVDIQVSASAGVAYTARTGGLDAEMLLRNSEAAVHHAKQRGRDRHEVFGDELRSKAVRRLSIHRTLSTAIEENRLRVVFQPIIDAKTRTIVGAEALARLSDASGKEISPAEFIPVSEDSGFIAKIDEWVLRNVCHHAKTFSEWRHGEPLFVGCNLSAWSLSRPDLDAFVLKAVEHAGISPTLLCIEMTETTLIGASPATRRALLSLRDHGVRVGIDDFGTGYSSLTYLRDFPLSFVKVDREFVLNESDTNRAIVETVIRLAHALGLTVTAEGVETGAQAVWLSELGSDQLQGFFFSRPVPIDVLRPLITTR